MQLNAAAAPTFTASPLQSANTGFIYAIGRLQAMFPTLGHEMEYANLANTDPEALIKTAELKSVIDTPQHYLARQLCWVFTSAQGGEICTIIPRDENDLAEMIELLAPGGEQVVQAIVGRHSLTPVAPDCFRSDLHMMSPVQLFSFSMDEFLQALPVPEDDSESNLDRFRSTAKGLFAYLTQRAGNHGLSDEHRALNYLALKYPPIYLQAWQTQQEGKSLVAVDAKRASGGIRRIVTVSLVFRHASTHLVERYSCAIDVTDLFPFVTNSLTITYG
jgi:hypothetical protein